MSTPAIVQSLQLAGSDVGWPMRLSQRAFAALLEARRRHAGTFRLAQLRGTAQRTLSALSADDRLHLSRWLSLLLANDERGGTDLARLLARVEPMLAAQVDATSVRMREESFARSAGTAA